MTAEPNRRYRFDNVLIDVQNLRVAVGSEIRPLEPRSFRLLLFLVENRGRAVSKDELMAGVWPDTAVSDNSLARAITQIRKALDDDPKAPRYVETVPTVGYRFVGACAVEQEVPAATVPVSRSRKPATLVLAAGIGLVVATGAGTWWMLAGHGPFTPAALRVTRVSKLTSYLGDEREPSISPDGSYVAFSWSGPAGDNYDIYVVQAGGQQPLRLT